MNITVMSDQRQRLGRWGEQLAAQRLEESGYVLLERNWRCARGEIDLVAKDRDVIVFVEVKTRRGRDYGTPEEAFTRAKSKRLLELGQRYLLERDIDDVEWRVDLVAVELDQQGVLKRFVHIPNAAQTW